MQVMVLPSAGQIDALSSVSTKITAIGSSQLSVAVTASAGGIGSIQVSCKSIGIALNIGASVSGAMVMVWICSVTFPQSSVDVH